MQSIKRLFAHLELIRLIPELRVLKVGPVLSDELLDSYLIVRELVSPQLAASFVRTLYTMR